MMSQKGNIKGRLHVCSWTNYRWNPPLGHVADVSHYWPNCPAWACTDGRMGRVLGSCRLGDTSRVLRQQYAVQAGGHVWIRLTIDSSLLETSLPLLANGWVGWHTLCLHSLPQRNAIYVCATVRLWVETSRSLSSSAYLQQRTVERRERWGCRRR